MSDKSRTCPQCGGAMAYRLGEYQCGQCDHVEAAVSASPSVPAATPWRKPPEDTRSADAGFIAGSFSERDYSRPGTGNAKFDPAPTLNTEKMIFFGVFILRALLSIGVAGARAGADAGTAGAGPGSHAMVELVSLGLLCVVLYVPLAPLKWCCASYSCAMGVFGLAGLFFGALMLPVLGLLSSGAGHEGPGFLGFLGMLAGVLQTGVYLWFASILYRDMQKLQLG